MIEYVEERVINAPAQTVYDVITDFPAYPLWNAWIHHAEEKKNGIILVKTKINGKEKTFRHKLIEASAPHTFHWCDLGWFTKLAFGQRKRTIEIIDAQSCRYRCVLSIEGLAEKLAAKNFGDFMATGMRKEADSLKRFSEAL